MKTITSIQPASPPRRKTYTWQEMCANEVGIFKLYNAETIDTVRFVATPNGIIYVADERCEYASVGAWKNRTFERVRETITITFDTSEDEI